MNQYLAIFPQVDELLKRPRDEKRPFDNLYAAVELLKPIANENPASVASYCAASTCARLCFDSLEFNYLRKFLEISQGFEDDYLSEANGSSQLVQFCYKMPYLTPVALKNRATQALYYANQQQFEEALKPLLDCERAAEAVLALESEIVDVFFQDVYFEEAPEGTVAKKALMDALIHCLFYAAQVCQNLSLTKESAAFCKKCLFLQLQCYQYNSREWIKQAVDLQRYYAIQCDWEECSLFLNRAGQMCCEVLGLSAFGSQEVEALQEYNSAVYQIDILDVFKRLTQERAAVVGMPEEEQEVLLEYCFASAETMSQLLSHCYAAGFRCAEQGIYTMDTLVSFANQPHKNDHIMATFVDKLLEACKALLEAALEYYKLDGFVTMHANINLTLSHLYQLRGKYFENSKALYDHRIQLIRPLVYQISSQHFPRLYEELLAEMNEARYEAFCSVNDQYQHDEQLAASLAASSIEQFQIYVKYVEGTAFNRAKVELKKERPEFDDWIRFVHDDSIEGYIDACFNQSLIFSKFPFQRKQMMQNALNGFTYCEKLWKTFKARVDGDFEENLKLVSEMRVLMELRISQMEG